MRDVCPSKGCSNEALLTTLELYGTCAMCYRHGSPDAEFTIIANEAMFDKDNKIALLETAIEVLAEGLEGTQRYSDRTLRMLGGELDDIVVKSEWIEMAISDAKKRMTS